MSTALTRRRRLVLATASALALAGAYALTELPQAGATPAPPGIASTAGHLQDTPVRVEVLTPRRGDRAGTDGKGWIVDLNMTFHDTTLRQTGFTGLQLTGPATHANAAPFPGSFSPGRDDRNPGLVVLASTIKSSAPFSGSGTNLANLFNLSGITSRTAHKTGLWDTWIVGDSIAGKGVHSTLTVAVTADLNHNGVYDDAPDTVPDANHDGRVTAKDLRALGVASNIVTVPFHINGGPAA